MEQQWLYWAWHILQIVLCEYLLLELDLYQNQLQVSAVQIVKLMNGLHHLEKSIAYSHQPI